MMGKTLSILAVVLAVIAGMSIYPYNPINGIAAGVAAFLLVEVISLRRRISALEEKQRQASKTAGMEDAPPTRVASLERPSQGAPSMPPVSVTPAPTRERPAVHTGQRSPKVPVVHTVTEKRLLDLMSPVFSYFSGGNLVLKIGIVVLFFGVAFLLKYAAQRNLIPIEFRLIGVAGGGIALLAIGWFLRRKHQGYGLGLEGGGIGILYLVVFAAAKLYHLLPLPLALVVMIALVGLSCTLAVLQESRSLAVSGSIGGFLAPVLMSTGSGSHVMLFSYYALLNSGILGIAWFQAWRELNLVGFIFTFGIAALWGASAYQPQFFATTEPFLLLFFLMYAAISVLFALRQPLQLRGFIDGPLVFGLPIIATGLQFYLVRDFRYGMALSVLTLGLFYLSLARLLWHRMAHEMRLLTEAFLALGVVFGSLAIPLGLDHQWTTAAWALEGAAMIWVGVRQQRKLARLFGVLLQLGAALTFVDKAVYPVDSLLFGNQFFLGCGLIAAAALFSGYQLATNQEKCRSWETKLPLFLLTWGLIWWYFGGVRDLDRHLLSRALPVAILLFTCGTTLLCMIAVLRLRWRQLSLSLLLLLPIMILTVPSQMMARGAGSLLADYGWIAWPLAFCLQYALLFRCATNLPGRILPAWHALTLWLLLFVLTFQVAWQVDTIPHLAEAWTMASWGLVPTAFLFALEFRGNRLAWPVVRLAATYHGLGSGVPLFVLLLGCLLSFSLNGSPAPLAYIPVFNPLELAELALILLLGLRVVRRAAQQPATESKLLARLFTGWLPAVLLFLLLNVITARCAHFFSGVSYNADALFASTVFQTAIAALWSILAMAMTVGGAKKGKRRIWLGGSVLLAMVVFKLFVIDLSGTGTIGRIVSFLVVGLLMLIIGFFAPLPPKTAENSR